MNTQELAIFTELTQLEQEHRELDQRIEGQGHGEVMGEFEYRRIKKRKLWLKDRIALLRSILYPDVIA